MTGMAQSEMDVPVMKSTAGVLAFDRLDEAAGHHAGHGYACLGCGRCAQVCPMRLVPSFLAKYVNKNRIDEAQEWGVQDCIECGACAYICPSKNNLVHYIKLGKYLAARQQRQQNG
jgi:electron transport complex protein RnfC